MNKLITHVTLNFGLCLLYHYLSINNIKVGSLKDDESMGTMC